MVDEVGDVHLTFKLWAPAISVSEKALCCELDVTTIGECLINEGDESLLGSFLSAVGIEWEGGLAWEVDYFCTPYYSDYPNRLDWRDWLTRAWRVRIRFSGSLLGPSRLALGPYGVDAWDSTFADEDEDWERGIEDCVVIAEAEEGVDLSFLEGMPYDIHIAELPLRSTVSREVRISLGQLSLPSETDRVTEVIETCRAHGARTNWADTLRRT